MNDIFAFAEQNFRDQFSENDQQLELEYRQQCADDRRQTEAHQLEQERQQLCEHALREALTKGVSITNLHVLCSETGISYDRIIGNI